MKIFGRNLQSKFGNELDIPEIKVEDPDPNQRFLVVWHEMLDIEDVRSLRERWPKIQFLLIATGPTQKGVDSKVSIDDHAWIHGLSWGLPNLQGNEHWCKVNPRWKTSRIREFVRVVKKSDYEIPWHILEPPKVPEHILACYLCAIGGVDVDKVPDGWQGGFEDESSYWHSQAVDFPALSWADRGNAIVLRRFLSNTEVIIGHSEQGKADAVE